MNIIIALYCWNEIWSTKVKLEFYIQNKNLTKMLPIIQFLTIEWFSYDIISCLQSFILILLLIYKYFSCIN